MLALALVVGLICPLAPILPICQTQPALHQPIALSLKEGVSLLRQKKYAEAKEVFLSITNRDPGFGQGYFYLGLTELNLGNTDSAEKSFRHALELNPRSKETLFNLGVLLLGQRRPVEAIRFLGEAHGMDPHDPALCLNLIRAYFDSGQTDAGLSFAESTKGDFKGQPAFYLALGKYLLSKGWVSQGRNSLENANRLAPSEPDILIPLADTYLRQREPAEARRVLKSLGGKADGIAEYHYLLAVSYFSSGQKDPALKEMTVAIHLDPQNVRYLLLLARYYQKYGEQGKAVSVLHEASRLAPNDPEIPYSAAVSYFIAGDYEVSQKFSRRALELKPKFGPALLLLGIVLAAKGHLTEAETPLGMAVDQDPQNPFYHTIYGMVLSSDNQLPEALVHFQTALTVMPNYALAYYQAGRVLARSGKYEEAANDFEKAVAQQPNLTEAYYHLAQTYRKLGETEKAQTALANFLKNNSAEYSERQDMLKQMQEIVRDSR
jgi:tetratricopeptide (TPR) repeat protein